MKELECGGKLEGIDMLLPPSGFGACIIDSIIMPELVIIAAILAQVINQAN